MSHGHLGAGPKQEGGVSDNHRLAKYRLLILISFTKVPVKQIGDIYCVSLQVRLSSLYGKKTRTKKTKTTDILQI